ncbi:hypothetical protein GQ44DRAFT_719308 [Phaeosphaeriaceae sp. PMI808]|nr:hypothetical protein GQ44DRAFT_719308 [Phaeosphaeriaceae sp. PMI808]
MPHIFLQVFSAARIRQDRAKSTRQRLASAERQRRHLPFPPLKAPRQASVSSKNIDNSDLIVHSSQLNSGSRRTHLPIFQYRNVSEPPGLVH